MCVCFGAFCGYSCLSKCIANISNLSIARQIFTTRLGKSSIEKLMLNVYKYKAFCVVVFCLLEKRWCKRVIFFPLPIYVLYLCHFFLIVIACYLRIDTIWRFARIHIHFHTSHILQWILYLYGGWNGLVWHPRKRLYINILHQAGIFIFLSSQSDPRRKISSHCIWPHLW